MLGGRCRPVREECGWLSSNGAATGRAGTGAAIGAAAGGIGGAGVGGTCNYSKSKDGYDRAFSACMSGRGYTVR